ncbi:MAG: exosortase/archaeosortase family protein [Candidatus Diapherotrites archaeon]|nr:exosortase/archaeosortase family protein [Candidatus Diapherotrites archaeon]
MPGKGLRFAVGIVVFGSLAYLALSGVMPALQGLTAWMSAALLSVFGVAYSQGALVFFNSLSVRVIPLCVGDIEVAVLAGAIFSTEDRAKRERVFGIAGAFAFVMMINALRIAATMLAWQAWGAGAVEIVHSVLFRATLVVAIVGFYAAWYLRDVLREKLKLGRLLTEK